MNVERDRLLALIEFSQHSARLQGRPASAVASHGAFALYEHEIRGLPGIRLNVSVAETDEIWLAVERLHEKKPPDIASPVVLPWVRMTQSPAEEPQLREATDGASLIAAGTHCPSAKPPEEGKAVIDPEATVILLDYDRCALVKASFATYLETRWRPWAEEEKLRRKSIRLYAQLFTLTQQFEGALVEAPLELVWGVGLGIWNCSGATVSYPILGRLVEMSLNPVTAAVEIRPRDVDARIEVDWYASTDNPGIAGLEKAAKEFFGKATTTFSPFDRGTFEPLLRTAVTNLDANGIYWPSEVPAEDRTLPKPENKLKITDTWVLFARPRTNSLFLQDLERLKSRVGEARSLAPAAAAIVTDPAQTNSVVELPCFRGVSAAYHDGSGSAGKKAQDLYFPKPFNDEQVRVVQLLESNDGVIVQGPPGTGKTHTIANVICHYLAEGKRVLVTSMKDPALAVLQEKLPEEIRPLAISLLSSEQAGMKQFEYAIQKIASEIQSLDRTATARAIGHLTDSIDALHGKLAAIDHKMGEWARLNLAKIMLDGEEIAPQDAARKVVENQGLVEWIPDSLGIDPKFTPQFADTDIMRLREARRILGPDIDYLDASLPQLVEFPDAKKMLGVHQDLSRLERLTQSVLRGDVPAIADSSPQTMALASSLSGQIETLERLRDEAYRASWTTAMRERIRSGRDGELLQMLDSLGADLEQCAERRLVFIDRPVVAAAGIDLDAEMTEAVRNLANGKSPFGLNGLFGKSDRKRQLASIRVLGVPPASALDWQHVVLHLALLRDLRLIAARWNALAVELQLPLVAADTPGGGVTAVQEYAQYVKVQRVVTAERELCSLSSKVFPNWAGVREVADSPQRLAELEQALRHHLTKDRLANVWATKERVQTVLDARSGRVIRDLRTFFSKTLGNAEVEDALMQADWSSLMAELSRVLALSTHVETVRDVCGKIEASGAPKYAASLKQPVEGGVDRLLPDNWRRAWRLRRLTTHLDSIDAQDALKKLGQDRHEVEGDLSRAYREVVARRTWLKLAENASPSIRAALQAYLNAVMKIGTGKGGKRAVRYRQDARAAASQANPAVPCWIMPHYRVSESLPAELGCFDLVIIDEASQSDLTALPSLLRAKKVLIVGDDKQVSPEGVGLEEEKIRSLMSRFLSGQVEIYRQQMSPERSIYDLFKVVFAKSTVMLKEHFRCVGPIIEYSKREFYNHELQPLRMPTTSERLDPPLIDVLVEDGFRSGDVNRPEAHFIVEEIKKIAADPAMNGRSIGVVSLLGTKQAPDIWERLTSELGPEAMQRHDITCGDARAFQGKERDIMFLSMVAASNTVNAPLSRDAFERSFNVAASRAKNRMYLVRSVEADRLSNADRLRRSLIAHFTTPYAQDETRVDDLRKLCESPFEREMYDELVQRGYCVTPQVKVGQYRIDLVVEGHNDTRLAVECDGDKYHGPDKWADDMRRERVLRRAGWDFWRCFASTFVRRKSDVLNDLVKSLAKRGIEPIGAEGAPRSVHTEFRVVTTVDATASKGGSIRVDVFDGGQEAKVDELQPQADSPEEFVPPPEPLSLFPAGRVPLGNDGAGSPSIDWRAQGLPFVDYLVYSGPPGVDPRSGDTHAICEGIGRIVEVEGPIIAKRVYDIYLRSCGIRRMGHELKSAMNKALSHAAREGRVVCEDEAGRGGILFSIVRTKGSPPIRLRTRGPRAFEEIPPSELLVVAKHLLERQGFSPGSDEHLRAVLEFFDLKRLTTQVGTTLLEMLEMRLPQVDAFFSSKDAMPKASA